MYVCVWVCMWLFGFSGAIGNSGCLPCGLIWSIMLCNTSDTGLSSFSCLGEFFSFLVVLQWSRWHAGKPLRHALGVTFSFACTYQKVAKGRGKPQCPPSPCSRWGWPIIALWWILKRFQTATRLGSMASGSRTWPGVDQQDPSDDDPRMCWQRPFVSISFL